MSAPVNLRKIQSQIMRYSLGDFSGRIRFNGQDEYWDSVSVSLNMLGEELREITVSKEFFLNIFNAIPDMLLITDSVGKVLTANTAASMLAGISSGQHFDQSFTSGAAAGAFTYLKRMYRLGDPLHEFPLRSYGQADRYFSGRISALVEEVRSNKYIVLIKDVTAQEAAARQLEASEKRFRGIFQNSSDGIILINAEGDILQMNESACSLCHDEEQKRSRIQDTLRFSGAKSFTRQHLAQIRKGITNREILMLGSEGTTTACLLSSVLLDEEDGVAVSQLMIKNISQYREHRKQLMRAVNEQQELERQRIANDLHDSVGQHLSSLKFMLSAVRKTIGSGEADEMLSDISNSVSQVIDELRAVSFDLMPGTLHRFGLRHTIEELLGRMRKVHPAVQFNFVASDGSLDTSQEIKVHCYRMVQEFVANSTKHGAPRTISIQLRIQKGKYLMLQMEDDGKGFNLRNALKGSTRGLQNIISRTDSCGGHVWMKSAPGEGTIFTITIPTV